MDPTGTTQLRSRFRADAQRRIGKLRSITYNQLVEKDALNPLANIFTQGPYRPDGILVAFNEWFKHVATMSLVEDGWWHRHLKLAYTSGIKKAEEILKAARGKPLDYAADPPQRYLHMAQTDLESIAIALSQQAIRGLTMGSQQRQKPLNTYRQVLEQIRKIGTNRLNTFSNSHTVLAHNAGRLEVFRAAGIGAVGVIPETLPAFSPSSRVRARDHFHHHYYRDASAKQELAAAEKAAERLLERQESEREKAQEKEAKALREQTKELKKEIAANAEGKELDKSLKEAKAELAEARRAARGEVGEARERTKAQEAEAREAWKEVLEARKAARAEGYEARERGNAAGRRAREAQKEGEESNFVSVATAGDDRVCDICEDIAAAGPYTLEEARELIPAHPRCRCTFVPAFEEEEDDEDDDDEDDVASAEFEL